MGLFVRVVLACSVALFACGSTTGAPPAGGGGAAGPVVDGGGTGGSAGSGGLGSSSSGGFSSSSGAVGGPDAAANACANGATPAKVAADLKLDASYADRYAAYDLGEVPGVPPSKYGGIVLALDDENALLIGGNANLADGAVYRVRVVRGACKHITGFDGTASRALSAPYIDGGLVYGPNNALMFTGYPVNTIGIVPAGAAAPANTIDATSLGITTSLGAFAFVPVGFPGAGSFKVVSWPSGDFYHADVSVDGTGAVAVTNAVKTLTLGGGPEGFAYVPMGSPLFDAPSMILAEWSANTIATYTLDASGDPVLASRRTFLTGLSGAEGAFFDPPTGDYIFSTWNGSGPERVIVIQGFAPAHPLK